MKTRAEVLPLRLRQQLEADQNVSAHAFRLSPSLNGDFLVDLESRLWAGAPRSGMYGSDGRTLNCLTSLTELGVCQALFAVARTGPFAALV